MQLGPWAWVSPLYDILFDYLHILPLQFMYEYPGLIRSILRALCTLLNWECTWLPVRLKKRRSHKMISYIFGQWNCTSEVMVTTMRHWHRVLGDRLRDVKNWRRLTAPQLKTISHHILTCMIRLRSQAVPTYNGRMSYSSVLPVMRLCH